MVVIDALRAISLYPINPSTATLIAAECGLDGQEYASDEILQSSKYKKAKAKVYIYLAEAPAVSEGGATYSFTDDERKRFMAKAADILQAIQEEEEGLDEVGWIGEEL